MGSRNGKNGKNARALDLVGTFEAHLILGVERSRIASFLDKNRHGGDKIPHPAAELRCGPIWRREDIVRRARQMYAEAGCPHGQGDAGFERWVVERAVKRALALPSPLGAGALSEVIGFRVPEGAVPEPELVAA